jgi:glycosyltransferase involved in cell wall biosynthesis
MNSPSVSVLFPVYNGAPYLEDAINSILNQTYEDFEIIIIDDGSTDNSSSIIQQFKDTRIRFYAQKNQGLASTLNRAIKLSRGKYLARQDQDDLSFPKRLQKQVEFLESHPNHGLVGTWAEIWKGSNKTEKAHKHPTDNMILRFDMLFDNPFVHSSVMLRKTVFDKVGLYSTDKCRQPPEDYELWSRIARQFEVANIPEILHIYREAPKSMSRNGINPFLEKVVNISAENLAFEAGIDVPNQMIIDIAALSHGAYNMISDEPPLKEISAFLIDLTKRIDNSLDSSVSSHDILKQKSQIQLQSIRNNYFRFLYGERICKIVGLIYCLLRRTGITIQ